MEPKKEETPVSNNTTENEKIEEIVDSELLLASEKIEQIRNLIQEAKAPKPRDVPDNEAWIVKIKDTEEEVIGFRNPTIDASFPWVVNQKDWTGAARYSDYGVDLVTRLVPEEEVSSLPVGTTLRTIADYRSAPIGTCVRHICGVEYLKVGEDRWESQLTGNFFSTLSMADNDRKVVKA